MLTASPRVELLYAESTYIQSSPTCLYNVRVPSDLVAPGCLLKVAVAVPLFPSKPIIKSMSNMLSHSGITVGGCAAKQDTVIKDSTRILVNASKHNLTIFFMINTSLFCLLSFYITRKTLGNYNFPSVFLFSLNFNKISPLIWRN